MERLSRSLVGGRNTVSSGHLGRPPTKQTHRVAFPPASRKELVGSCVAKLMRMELGDTGLSAASPKDLCHT